MPEHKTFWNRFLEAMYESRMSQANRIVAEHRVIHDGFPKDRDI